MPGRAREPANIDAIAEILRQDPYDLELLISFGTSKGGSAGHLALAIRDGTLGETASFGLDFGEIYKRSVIGIRVNGLAAGEKDAIAAYFKRINDDYHQRASDTEYHAGEIKYDYQRLNCAKTIGSAFRFAAGYGDQEISSAKVLTRRRMVVAAKANIPSEMAIKLIKAWHQRCYAMDVVLYKKYGGSAHVDLQDEDKVAFKDSPNRFPSVLSREFRSDEGEYQNFDNLFAMYA